MEPVTFLVLLTGGALAVNFLGTITAPAAAFLKRVNSETLRLAPQDNLIEQQPPPADPAPQEKRASWWWKELLSLKAMLGLLFTPVELPILAVNSFLIAATFEVILDHPGQPLFSLPGWWEREVTDFDLYGVLISLCQMICASARHHARAEERKSSMIRTIASVALLSLVSFEVGAAVYRGWKLDGDPWNAALSGLIALGIAGTEVVVGVYMIDWFLGPLLLAVLWSVTSPAWALAGWWERRKARRHWVQASRKANPALVTLAWPLAVVDHAVMNPLRRLDSAIGSLFLRKKHESNTKGGTNNAEALLEKHSDSTSGNGSDRGVQSATAQTATTVDHRAGYHYLDPS